MLPDHIIILNNFYLMDRVVVFLVNEVLTGKFLRRSTISRIEINIVSSCSAIESSSQIKYLSIVYIYIYIYIYI